ncbi:class C sortase [Corynebacterium lizhenjunii]|uniref:class C sortase n=1 Tax=Corynebacterium lizhenjunii TaxID=2709394 RepID=UPI001F442BC7|nr:class C sortase [Corynebacterium lizhenjunii]
MTVETTNRPLGPPPGPPAGQGQKRRKASNVLIPVLLVLAGLCVLLYPVVATQWNNWQQTRVADAYAQFESTQAPEVIDQQLSDALEYNATRGQASLSDPWSGTQDRHNAEYQAYEQQLANYEAMGRIAIPKASINLPIYHGTSHDVLQRGVGHLFGTDLPVGGENRHAALTGHTGLQNATLFDNLSTVAVGDAVYLHVAGQKMKYQVFDIDVVLPEEVDSLARVEGKDLITLVTCTPYGINTHRLLVHAERVPMDPEEEGVFEDSGFHWQWWMWAFLAAALLVLLVLGLWLRSTLRKNK